MTPYLNLCTHLNLVLYLENSEVSPQTEVLVDVPEGLARARVQEVRDVVGGMACETIVS